MKRNSDETSLQIAVSDYIKLRYKGVVFTAESSGLRVPIGTAKKMKRQRSVHKQPDMIILEPRGNYCGLILELKKTGTRLKDGSLPNNEHINEQKKTLKLLSDKGYCASFAVGFDEAQITIDSYMMLGKRIINAKSD